MPTLAMYPESFQKKKEPTRRKGSCVPPLVRTDSKLSRGTETRKIIDRLTKHIDKARYKNITDFVFVEFFPGWKKYCLDFYRGKGPHLKRHPGMTPIRLEFYDRFIAEVALEAIQHFSRCSWEELLEFVDTISNLPVFALRLNPDGLSHGEVSG